MRAATLPISGEASSSTVVVSDGNIRLSDPPNLNLTHDQVILGLNTAQTTAMVTGKLVVRSDFAGNSSEGLNSGEQVTELQGRDGLNGVVWRNGERTQYYQHTRVG